MNSICRAVVSIFLTAALFLSMSVVGNTSQSTASRSDAGTHLCSVMRSKQRMLQNRVHGSVSERASYHTSGTYKHGDLPTRNDIVDKPEVTHNWYPAAPPNTQPRRDRSKPGGSVRGRSRRSRKSTGRDDHRRVGEEIAVLASQTRNSDSSLSSHRGRMFMTSLHSASTSGEWRAKIANFETDDDAEIKYQSVTRFNRYRKSTVVLTTDLDTALVNETVLFVQNNRETYIGDIRSLGYGNGPNRLNHDKDGTKDYGSVRRRRDSGSSDTTTHEYTSESMSDAGVSANHGTTSPQKEEGQTATQNVSKSVTENASLGSNSTKDATEGHTSLPKTTLAVDPRGNVSMPTDNRGLITTSGGGHVDHRSTVKESARQKDAEAAGDSCSEASDFGEYGVRTFVVSVGIVVLLVYILGMVLVTRRFLRRRRFEAALDCPHQGSKGSGWLDVAPGPFPFDIEMEEPLTDSQLNLLALDTPLTYESAPGGETTREDNSHNVSTFLLRRESQQKAEERRTRGKEEIQHHQFVITTTEL